MTILAIDADIIAYQSAFVAEKEVKWDEDLWTLWSNEEEATSIAINKITEIYESFREKYNDPTCLVVLCWSSKSSFRKKLWPDYKANRKNKRKPLAFKKIVEQVREKYQSKSFDGLEGDDVMALLATSKQYDNPIIVSVDKDMRSVPCTLLAGDDLELITKRKADRHWMKQALTGDSTDNYFGIDKVGPVTAEKILGESKTLEQMWEKVVAAYEKKKYDFADAVLNAQLARILRDGDFDYKTGEVSLWTP